MEEPVKLKYLFVAEYIDGTFFKQQAHDKSSLDEKRSQFYDLLNSGKEIHRFSLVGAGNTITVDLKTGVFYVNGLGVLLESDKLPVIPDKFNLIFYRQWTKSMDVTYELDTKKVTDRQNPSSFCEYFIGWECEINGKHYKQKLAVA